MKHQPIQIGAIALLMSFATLTYAASKAAVVIPVEGNATCNTFAKNKIIQQMRTQSIAPSGSVSDSVYSADYVVTDLMKTASFSSEVSIDFAILKSGGYGALFIYPSGGVANDADMQLLAAKSANQTPVPQQIDAISLCYGLGNSAPKPATIPNCSDVDLDGLDIMCPSNGKKSIIFNFEIDGEPLFYNTANTPIACVCNSTPLQMCDPNVVYDASHPENGACPQPVGGDKTGAEVTTHVELNNDPYVCSTAGGIRTCFSY